MPMKKTDKAHTCCFTGHRPQKLAQNENQMRPLLEKAILQAIDKGFTSFISGMAPGVDIWAGEAVCRLRNEYGLRLICAVPCPGFADGWPEEQRLRYGALLAKADESFYVCDKPDPKCCSLRNRRMVADSGLVIAAYNGTQGGTAETVAYAKAAGIEIIYII